MSASHSTVGAMDASSLPTPLSPPAPMLVDGSTPDRVQGRQPPVPGTHRGDFYTPALPSSRPGPSSTPMGGAYTQSSTSWNRQGLAQSATDLATYDPFLAGSAVYNMQHGSASSKTEWVDYSLPQGRPSSEGGTLFSFPGQSKLTRTEFVNDSVSEWQSCGCVFA